MAQTCQGLADVFKGRSQTQNHYGLEKWSGKKWAAIQSGWLHLGKKKSTAAVEDEKQEVAVF